MALQPHRLEFKPQWLEFMFGMVLAMAVTILAITTWAAPSNPERVGCAGPADLPYTGHTVGTLPAPLVTRQPSSRW
jgi:hypothetical protein